MINKLIGVATLFTASAIFMAGAPQLSATPVAGSSNDAARFQAGTCGGQETKPADAAKAPAKAPAKAQDGKGEAEACCGKDGGCGKEMKKDQEEGACSKDTKAQKEAACGKDKQ